ncbi:MAG: glycosyltransferase family 4 protein [Thermotogota bacterium]
MKIVQIASLSETVQAFLFPLMEKLIQKGHEIDVITSDKDSKLKNNHFIEENNIAVYDVNIPIKFSPWKLFTAYSTMLELFKGLKPDIIHTHSPFASLIARNAASSAKVPYIIYTSHGFYFTEHMNWFKRHFFAYLEKRAAKKCTDYLFTVNSEDKAYAIKHHFMDEEKIINLQSVGVDTKVKFNPIRIHSNVKDTLREELNINKDEKIFNYTGFIIPEKGIVELLQAFTILHQKYPYVKLIIAGEPREKKQDKKYEGKVKNIIRTNKLEKEVRFLGYRTDVPELLSITDVFVLPSHKEGMSISSLEALSMGVPVVGTNIRGVREEIIDGKTGYLVPYQDVTQLFKAMEKAMNEFRVPDDRCRKQAIENFDEEDVLRKQLDVYRLLETKIKEMEEGGQTDE